MSILYPQVLILLLVVIWLYKKSSILLYISLSLMILALSCPVLVEQKVDETLKGKELIIALDISYSMRAQDLKPSRQEVAKELIRQILTNNKNDRFSLFAFTINPLILSPSTTDHQLLITAINSLNIDNILTHGTNLENLFNRIAKIKIAQKDILLFSDGGNIIDVDSLISLCRSKGIRVFAVGLGTKSGSTLVDEYGKNIKDSKGNLVVSRLNPKLEELAVQSGGEFIKLDYLDLSLDFIDQHKFSKKQKIGFMELFWIPLILALFMFWFNFIKVPKKLLAMIPFLAISSNASLLDWYYINQAKSSYEKKDYKQATYYFEDIGYKTMQSQMNLANSYYQLGQYKKAKSIYQDLKSTNPRTKQLIFYKLGNCQSQLKKYKSAKKYYKNALVFGKDEDIIYNLKLISFKKDENRRDFPAFHSKDKAKENTPQGSSKKRSKQKQEKYKLKNKEQNRVETNLKRPLGFKAYELINKGYINEKNPW